jgi:hypothetical protein
MLGHMDVCHRRRHPRDRRDHLDVAVDSDVDRAIATTDVAREAPAGPVDVMAAAHNWLARTRSGGVVWPTPDGT